MAPHGWRVIGTPDGMAWGPVTRTVLDVARGDNADRRPSAAWFRTQKGRGYGKVDAASHGTPHPLNSPAFWAGRQAFMERYGVTYEGVDQPAPADPAARAAQAEANLRTAISVLRRDPALVTWLSDRLVAIAATVPDDIPGVRLGRPESAGIFADPRFTDARAYPGRRLQGARRAGAEPGRPRHLGRLGERRAPGQDYGRPLFVVASADLAESTNIAGFGKDFGDQPGFGWYERDTNPTGDGPAAGDHRVRQRRDRGRHGVGQLRRGSVHGASTGSGARCSTYASFSYLKYGPMRLFSQLAQDTELRLGRLLWVAGHSGPETAEDSRTHFGIFETGVTQLFPERRGHRPAPLGAQRGPGHAGGGARHGRPDHRPPPDPTAGPDPRSRGPRDAVALRGGSRRLRAAALPARACRGWARSSSAAR